MLTQSIDYHSQNFSGFRQNFSIAQQPLKEKTIAKFNILSISMNLISTGPMFVPGVFLYVGWDVSLLLILVLSIINYITTEFLIQSLSIINAIEHLPNSRFSQSHSNITDMAETSINDSKLKQIENLLNISDRDNLFSLRSQFEYTELAAFFWGKTGMIVTTAILMLYLLGKMISQSISVAQVLCVMFEGHILVENYYFWLITFFIMVLGLTFMNTSKLLPLGILTLRFFCIFLMITGSLYLSLFRQTNDIFISSGFKNFTFQKFEDIFSTLVFSFLIHHNIPNNITPLRPEKKIKSALGMAYFISIAVQVLVPITGGMAFGQQMTSTDEQEYKFFIYNFKGQIQWLYSILTIFVVFSVLSYAGHNNTLRNNMMKIWAPQKIPKKGFNRTSVIYTICPLAFIFIVAASYRNIVVIVQISGGIFGVFIMMVFPSLFVLHSRELINSKCMNYRNNFHRTLLSNRFLPYIILTTSIFIIFLNLYRYLVY